MNATAVKGHFDRDMTLNWKAVGNVWNIEVSPVIQRQNYDTGLELSRAGVKIKSSTYPHCRRPWNHPSLKYPHYQHPIIPWFFQIFSTSLLGKRLDDSRVKIFKILMQAAEISNT